jgi:RNA polymerase sigma-70 factor, ECF subfamily
VKSPLADSISDEEIVRRVLAGSVNEFETLVRRHTRALYSLGMSFFHNPDDATDFAQEVFLKAYSHLVGFQYRSKFSTWLMRIGYNEGVNGARKAKRIEPLEAEDEIPDELTPLDIQLLKEAREEVGRAMAELPPQAAACVQMAFFQDMSYAEIGEVTGLPINTIKSHVFRAKERLRESLSGRV